MITLTSAWTDTRLGCTFPAGTVFIPQRPARNGGTVYTYGTPGGGRGEVLISVGIVPGTEYEDNNTNESEGYYS